MQRTTTRLRPHVRLLLAAMLLGAAACGDQGEKPAGRTAAAPPAAGTVPASNTTPALANTTLPLPPDSVYSGPLFQLSHAWPTQLPSWSDSTPWAKATQGQPVTQANALAYTLAIKKYITPAMRQLLATPGWNAGQAGWFNQPWLASIREPIHGMYVGSTFPPGTLAGQTDSITTYVITYYDSLAAYTVGQVWGQNAAQPTPANAQFAQNAVIIKLAFQTGAPSGFPAMKGTAEWQIYAPNAATTDTTPQLQTVYLMQVDMIVKDTVASPNTGWVFTTLVYDSNLPPLVTDPWDKMVPLGAMWGNDPQASSPSQPLKETFIYSAAPAYAKSTLGWGGRLSGPNDGAVVAPAVFTTDTLTTIPSVAASSCMSCHGAAETPMNSFLLPSPTDSGTVANGSLALYPPGSAQWMRWFRNRPGNTPQDTGTTALDYDMVFAFKSIPLWAAAQESAPTVNLAMVERIRHFRQPRNQYNGVPLPEARRPRRQ